MSSWPSSRILEQVALSWAHGLCQLRGELESSALTPPRENRVSPVRRTDLKHDAGRVILEVVNLDQNLDVFEMNFFQK